MRQHNQPRTICRQFMSPARLLLAGLGGCLLAAALVSTPVLAESGDVYRWIGEDGTPHYGERAPKGVEATLIKKAKRVKRELVKRNSQVVTTQYKGSEPTPQFNGQPAPLNTATVPLPKPKKNKEICERAQYNLKVLSERARIRQKDENGEERFLSDEEKNEQKEAAQKAVNSYC